MRLTPASFVAAAGLAMLAGCAASERPIIYPNAKAQQVGASVQQADIDDCIARAQSSGATNTRGPKGKDVAINTGTGAAVGAATGAVFGRAGKGAAAGAAGAATGTVVRGILRPQGSSTHRRFVELCLREKGYQITGWQ
jgi:hypothetical protein